MPKCFRVPGAVLLLVLRLTAPAAVAQPPANAEPPGLEMPKDALSPAVEAYLEGLTALESAKWSDATAAFSKAIDADPDNEAYHRARGVANTLAEKLADALTDLRRSSKLKLGDKESRIWLAVALQMSGDAYHARETYAEATNDAYETFLGKMRREYSVLDFSIKLSRTPNGQITPQQKREGEVARQAARDKFAEAGAWYASRMKAAPELGQTLFTPAATISLTTTWLGFLSDKRLRHAASSK